MRHLPHAATCSEPEVQTTADAPGRSAVTTPEHGTAAGVDAHGGVGEVVGGVVEAEFHQSTVVGIAVDAGAIGGSGFQEGHLLLVAAEAPVGDPAQAQGRHEQGAFPITDRMGEFHGEFGTELVDFHLVVAEPITAIAAGFAEAIEAGVGVTELGLRFDDPVAGIKRCAKAEHTGPGVAAAVTTCGLAVHRAPVFTVVTTGAEHATQVEVVGPVLGIAATTPAIGIPAAAGAIADIHRGVGAEQTDAGGAAEGNVKAELDTTVVDIGIAVTAGGGAVTPPEATQPHVEARFVGAAGVQNGVGLEDLEVTNAVEDHDGSVVEINCGVLALGEVVVAQLLIEVGLGCGVIEGLALEPQRPDRLHRRRGGFRRRFWGGLGVRLRGFLVLAVGRWRRKVFARPEARGNDDKLAGLFWVFWIFRGGAGIRCRQTHLSSEGINDAAFSSGVTRLQKGQGEQRSSEERHRDNAAEQNSLDLHQLTINSKILRRSG